MYVNLNVIFFPSYGLNLYYTIADNNADIRQELITRNFVKEVDPTTPLWRPLRNKADGFECIGKESSRTSVSSAIV